MANGNPINLQQNHYLHSTCFKSTRMYIKVTGFRLLDATLAAVFICEECHKPFPSAAAVRQHLRSCVDPKRQLRVQLQHLTEKQLLSHQVPENHIDDLLKQCAKCNLKFADSNSFILHVAVHKLTTTIERKKSELLKSFAPFKAHVCDFPDCWYSSNEVRSIKWHQARVHDFVSAKYKESVFKCQYCGFTFMTMSHFNAHLKKHKMEQLGVFKCLRTGCSKHFSSVSELREHSNAHQLVKFTCEECGKFYGTKYALKYHMMRHSEQRSFRCDVPGCSYAGKLKIDLNNHKRLGHENPGFVCHLCGKFLRSLKFHLQLHETGTAGVFKCVYNHCSHTRFSSTDDLRNHYMLNHERKT
jgi:Zinc finger, C2H2 type